MGMTNLDRKLQAGALLARRVEGDGLMLADAVLLQALDGSRPLTHGERAALQASPLTLRRLRHLADVRRTQHMTWTGSAGLLRAADSGVPLDVLRTDWKFDGFVVADWYFAYCGSPFPQQWTHCCILSVRFHAFLVTFARWLQVCADQDSV